MSFWAYLIQCADRHFYAGHTDDLERRLGQHQLGAVPGYTRTRRPVHLVWSEEFPSRYEALVAEKKIKGWSRAKKLALIRGDWGTISALACGKEKEGRASTSSARTVGGWRAERILHPHPAALPSQPFHIEAQVIDREGELRVTFVVQGPVGDLRLSSIQTPARRDELWQSTCFELFASSGERYCEYNLSPSTEWAAYAFDGYRAGMRDLEANGPESFVSVSDKKLKLVGTIRPPERPTRIGVSAVIEEVSGRKSYWALRHPPGDTPDFHHPDCFALEVPPASEP